MNIIIFGATGGLGQWTWKAAVKAGHEVTAFVRSPSRLDSEVPGYDKLKVVRGDVMDAPAVRAASVGCDIAVNCTSPAGGNSTLEMARSIAENASASGVETFYMVGGMGALFVPGTDLSVLLQDWEDAGAMARFGIPVDMPRDMVRRMTQGHLASMAWMKESGLRHAFLCPGRMNDAPATDGRVVTLDELGGSSVMQVSMGDVAQVLVDDLDKGALLGHRVCIATH